MELVATLLSRNERFAKNRFAAGLTMLPSAKIMIIGCVDPRVDPAEIFALEPGEAAVIRNVGGRVTPNIFQTLALLRVVSKANGSEVGDGWNIVVLHHTDCGIRCLGQVQPMLAAYFGVPVEGLAKLAIDDPHAAVAIDIDALRSSHKLPDRLRVTGLVYDVKTGLVDTVVPSAFISPGAAPG